MKNIALFLSTITILQVSTCGNQSYSKYSRDGSIVEDLYAQYRDAHEDIETLEDQFNEVLGDKSDALKDWNKYDQFSKSYWRQARTYASGYDSALQQNLLDYFDQQEKRYNSATTQFQNESDKISKQTAEMQHNMSLLKLLASHKQLESYLEKNKPEIEVIQDYNKTLESTNTSVEKATKHLAKGKPVATTLE